MLFLIGKRLGKTIVVSSSIEWILNLSSVMMSMVITLIAWFMMELFVGQGLLMSIVDANMKSKDANGCMAQCFSFIPLDIQCVVIIFFVLWMTQRPVLMFVLITLFFGKVKCTYCTGMWFGVFTGCIVQIVFVYASYIIQYSADAMYMCYAIEKEYYKAKQEEWKQRMAALKDNTEKGKKGQVRVEVYYVIENQVVDEETRTKMAADGSAPPVPEITQAQMVPAQQMMQPQPGMMVPTQPGMAPMQPGMVPQQGMVYQQQQQPGMVPMQQPGMVPMQQPGMVPMQQPGMINQQAAYGSV
jgi:hypothetical protein